MAKLTSVIGSRQQTTRVTGFDGVAAHNFAVRARGAHVKAVRRLVCPTTGGVFASRIASFRGRIDMSAERLGYDIETRIPGIGRLRFIRAEDRVKGAKTVTITNNEIRTGPNKREDSILTIGLIDGDSESLDLRYVRRPFGCEPDFGATSTNYELAALLAQSEEPA
jgi:hypothetical protein